MSHWTLDDIPWGRFERAKINPELVSVVKASALVERNAGDYARYLCHVFPDDGPFCEAAAQWAAEEVQHGLALGRWAAIADPEFDFEGSFAAFVAGYRIPVDVVQSVRGSRTGELIARCVVESGTSSLYSALRDASDEPVLKAVCHRIAGDEFRHYRLFYRYLQKYLDRDKPWLIERALVAVRRYRETDDDELAFAYHCANHLGEPYERKQAAALYFSRAFACYQRGHMHRAIGMMAKAAGFEPGGRIVDLASRIAWGYTQRQIRQRRAA
jgi:hypothetical protein